eukprot:9195012-Pyramimonas_sp.AAC.1
MVKCRPDTPAPMNTGGGALVPIGWWVFRQGPGGRLTCPSAHTCAAIGPGARTFAHVCAAIGPGGRTFAHVCAAIGP